MINQMPLLAFIIGMEKNIISRYLILHMFYILEQKNFKQNNFNLLRSSIQNTNFGSRIYCLWYINALKCFVHLVSWLCTISAIPYQTIGVSRIAHRDKFFNMKIIKMRSQFSDKIDHNHYTCLSMNANL